MLDSLNICMIISKAHLNLFLIIRCDVMASRRPCKPLLGGTVIQKLFLLSTWLTWSFKYSPHPVIEILFHWSCFSLIALVWHYYFPKHDLFKIYCSFSHAETGATSVWAHLERSSFRAVLKRMHLNGCNTHVPDCGHIQCQWCKHPTVISKAAEPCHNMEASSPECVAIAQRGRE